MKSSAPVTKLCYCEQLPSNVTVPVSYIDSHGTDFRLCRKGNDKLTHEVGNLGVLTTPSLGILFFARVYSALSYSCILRNKIICWSAVFCLSVLHGYARAEKGGKSFFLCAGCSPSSLSWLVSAEALHKERQGSHQPLSTWGSSCDFHCSFWFISLGLERDSMILLHRTT